MFITVNDRDDDDFQDRVDMIDKAVRYLEHRLEEKQRPLTAAITAYALALAGSEWSREFNMKLMDHALTDQQGGCVCERERGGGWGGG